VTRRLPSSTITSDHTCFDDSCSRCTSPRLCRQIDQNISAPDRRWEAPTRRVGAPSPIESSNGQPSASMNYGGRHFQPNDGFPLPRMPTSVGNAHCNERKLSATTALITKLKPWYEKLNHPPRRIERPRAAATTLRARAHAPADVLRCAPAAASLCIKDPSADTDRFYVRRPCDVADMIELHRRLAVEATSVAFLVALMQRKATKVAPSISLCAI